MITARARMNSTSEWAQAIKDAAWPEIEAIADEIARAAEKNVQIIVDSEFGSDPRNSKPGSMRLRNSFEAIAEPSPGASIITVRLQTVAGADKAKVGALNYGSRSHRITGDPYLVFPGTHGVKGTVRIPYVNHPGTTAARFMERAINLAIQEVTGMRRR